MATETATQEAPKRTSCPQCGAKLPEIPVSLCPYCASPLETAADRRTSDSVNAARIARIREHADFPAAEAWTPPEGPAWQSGGRRRWWGRTLLSAGVIAIVFGVASNLEGRVFWNAPALLGLVAVIAGVWLIVKGTTLQRNAIAQPLLRRPGLIVDRRSETSIEGWTGSTTYYFTIELEDGVVGEFAFPGLGAQEEPYVTNLPGVAFTRGTDLLYFRHIRV